MGKGAASSGDLQQVVSLFSGGAIAGLEDGELLERFVRRQASGDLEVAEAAFNAIVARHGRMVLGVCRRALGHPQDAEDAFQATFLILARKAASVRVDDSLGRWLYGVSRKVAARARHRSDRRRAREVPAAPLDAPEHPGRPSAEDVAELADLRAVILEELGRLPPRFREAIEACDLDGCTHEDAARRLGWPVGTVRSRLSRARSRLRDRLARRGLGMTAAWAPIIRSHSGAVPAALTSATSGVAVRFAMRRIPAGTVPAGVATHTEGALRAMMLTKLTVAIPASLLVVGVAAAAAQFAVPGLQEAAPPPRADRPPAIDSRPVGAADGAGVPGLGSQAFGNPGFGGSGFEGAGKQITLQVGSMIVLQPTSRESITAYNAATGSSATYRLPEGVTADPVATDSVIALSMTGGAISQVAAYSPEANSWAVQDLATPIAGRVAPIVVGGLAAFADGSRVYAFSAAIGKWDVLERNEGADGRPVIYRDYVLCEDDEHVYVFGARTGRWDTIGTD